jgi:TctA family transporter
MVDDIGANPEKQNQRPAWTRYLDILLRSAHVLVISALFGGAVFQIPFDRLLPWRYLAAATGIVLIASEVAHRRYWQYQARGLMVYIHAGLFGLVVFRPGLAVPCLLAALIVGMFGSHMPKRLRYWSFLHGRVKD